MPPGPPPPTDPNATPQGGYPPYQPQQGYPQQGYYGQPGPYQQPPPPRPRDLRNGGTFEVSLGAGSLSANIDGSSNGPDSESGVAFAIAGGGWITPDLAITARWSSVTISPGSGDYDVNLTHGLLGVHAQRYLSDQFWLGGGLGIATAFLSGADVNDSGDNGTSGLGLDLRAGFNFNTGTENVINAQLEIIPGFYDEEGIDVRYTGVLLMLGYQHL